jgi:hypothetical protein
MCWRLQSTAVLARVCTACIVLSTEYAIFAAVSAHWKVLLNWMSTQLGPGCGHDCEVCMPCGTPPCDGTDTDSNSCQPECAMNSRWFGFTSVTNHVCHERCAYTVPHVGVHRHHAAESTCRWPTAVLNRVDLVRGPPALASARAAPHTGTRWNTPPRQTSRDVCLQTCDLAPLCCEQHVGSQQSTGTPTKHKAGWTSVPYSKWRL